MKRSNHSLRGIAFVVACCLIGLLAYQALTGRGVQTSDNPQATTGNSEETYTMVTDMPGTPESERWIDNGSGLSVQSQPSVNTAESGSEAGDADVAQLEEGMMEATRAGDSFDQNERDAVARYWNLDALCRGGSDDITATERACGQQERLFNEMERSGLCWGSVGDPSQRDYRWHHCDERSIQRQPVPPRS